MSRFKTIKEREARRERKLRAAEQAPHLFQFLGFDEWQLVFVVAFLAQTDAYGEAYPIHRYFTPGSEGETDSWIELFRRAIRYLSFEHGVTFTGIEAHRDGRIVGSIVEPGNIKYAQLLSGQASAPLPELPLTLRRALGYLEDHGIHSLDQEPILTALDQVERDVAWAKAQADPDVVVELDNLRDQALAEIGVERVGKGTVH